MNKIKFRNLKSTSKNDKSKLLILWRISQDIKFLQWNARDTNASEFLKVILYSIKIIIRTELAFNFNDSKEVFWWERNCWKIVENYFTSNCAKIKTIISWRTITAQHFPAIIMIQQMYTLNVKRSMQMNFSCNKINETFWLFFDMKYAESNT